ncbi:hypothetical protein LOK49_LG06G00239 [Camellia lanceoleosa]|uniref:Uncharacterized protein n=1 Tax=Camellia lanceoleosa TaxID=1840588 RepID=A0ACC0HBN7_9ERIC|nr:hypothetical protein LOK49_LG06G00239 [Camellia lanceoleosa]
MDRALGRAGGPGPSFELRSGLGGPGHFFSIIFNFFYQNFIIFHKKIHCASGGLGLGPSLKWALSGPMGRAGLQSDGLGPNLGSRTCSGPDPNELAPGRGRVSGSPRAAGQFYIPINVYVNMSM